MITFSVITCTYNASSVLKRTLNSVLRQSYQNVEHIIVDGASRDETVTMIKEYITKSDNSHNSRHNIVFTSEPDKGLYDAMNKGIKLATGDYLCFLNAGDGLHEDDTLLRIVHSLTGTILPDVIYGETDIVDDEGHFLYKRRLSAPETLHWKSFKKGMLVCHQAFFARRELALEEPYDLQYRFSADFDWCIRIMKKAKVLHNTHLTLIDYLNEGMTTRNHKASLKERFHIMAKHYGLVSTVLHHAWFAVRLAYK